MLDQFYVAYSSGTTQIRLVHGNPDLIPSVMVTEWTGPARAFRTVASRNGHVQLRLQTVRVAGGTLIASTSLAAVNKTVDQLGMILTIGSVAAALVAGLGVAWLMRRGLRPIETMADEADRITAGDLTDRVGQPDTRTEVGRLGAALNGMLARIEASIAEREASQQLTRRFFADASHELRNPLASLRANAELYQQGVLRRRPQVDEAMRRIAAEAQRMSGLVDDMLRLARLDQLPDQRHETVDVSAVVRGCAGRARAADPQRTWRTRVSPGLETSRRRGTAPPGAWTTCWPTSRRTPRPARWPRSPRPAAAAPWSSRSATTARACPPASWTGSSTGSTAAPRPRTGRAPGWAWPSSARSRPPTTAWPAPPSARRTGCASR